jgi:hypothetical protein
MKNSNTNTPYPESLILYADRSETINVIDRQSLNTTNDYHPLLRIGIDLINAGYEGIAVDEQVMSDGRFFQALNINEATPEGHVVRELLTEYQNLGRVPKMKEVWSRILDADKRMKAQGDSNG